MKKNSKFYIQNNKPEKNPGGHCQSFSKVIPAFFCYRKNLCSFVHLSNKGNRGYYPLHEEGCGAIASKIFSLVLFAIMAGRHNETGGEPEKRSQIGR